MFGCSIRVIIIKFSEISPTVSSNVTECIAALALYLCSDEASFVTGQAYPIDGGVLVA